VRAPSVGEVANRPTLVAEGGDRTLASVPSVPAVAAKRAWHLKPAARALIALGVVGAAVTAFVLLPGKRAPSSAALVTPAPAAPPAAAQAAVMPPPVPPAPPAAPPAASFRTVESLKVPATHKRGPLRVPRRHKTAQNDLDMPLNPYDRRSR
jgi:hypothetical protein